MKRRLIALAILIAALYVPGGAQQKGADDFTELVRRYYAAWNTLNPDNVAAM